MSHTMLKPLVVAVLFAMQVPVHALTLNTDARYEVTDTQGGGTLTAQDPKSANSGSITSYVDLDTGTGGIGGFAVAADGRNSARGSADDQGNLAVRASWEAANGTLNLYSAEARSSQTFVNSSGSTLDYSFTFSIPSGVLQVFDAASVDESSGLYAKYIVSILLNGSAIWESAAELKGGRVSHTLTETGNDIGGNFFFDGSYTLGYEFGPFNDTVSLGSLLNGQSLTLDYMMRVETGGRGSELGSHARFGDPNFVSTTPGLTGLVNITGSGGGQIPEPASLALLGLGLVGLAAMRRSR